MDPTDALDFSGEKISFPYPDSNPLGPNFYTVYTTPAPIYTVINYQLNT